MKIENAFMYVTHKTNCKIFFRQTTKGCMVELNLDSLTSFLNSKICLLSFTNKTLFDNKTACMTIFQKDQRKLSVKIHLKTPLSGCQLDFSIITLTVRCLNCIVAADDTSLAAWPTPWINSPGVGGANSVLPYFKKVAKRGLA